MQDQAIMSELGWRDRKNEKEMKNKNVQTKNELKASNNQLKNSRQERRVTCWYLCHEDYHDDCPDFE